MNKLHDIKRYYRVIDNSLFMVTGKLDYDRLTLAITQLAIAINEFDDDNDDMWSIGEYGSCDLASFIVGAYWHFTEWHSGQWSKGYEALSALGRIFSPNMSMPEPDNEAYIALNDMAGQ